MLRHNNSGYLIPRNLILALTLELVTFVLSLLLIKGFGTQHQGLILGVVTTTLYISATSFYLTAVGLTLAIWTSFPSLHREPVRALGTFPQYLAAAEKLVRKAKRKSKFDIQVDSPDHGSLGDFEKQCRLHEAIKDACRRKVDVRLLLLGDLARVSRANPYFDYRGDFEGFRNTRQFKKFFTKYWPGLSYPTMPEEFENLMDAYMRRVLQELRDCDVKVRCLAKEDADRVSSFFWSTTKEVLFVRHNVESGKRAEAFLTSHSHLVRAHKEEFERNWNIAQEL
jgi:hypothetical protein